MSMAAEHGLSFYELGKLVASGVVEQVARGIYRKSGGDIGEEDQFRIATLRVGAPSAICLVSALSHFHLTDTIAKQVWILVPDDKRTTERTIKPFRARKPQWEIGIETFDGYSITTLERTLVECLTNRSRIGSQIGLDALRKAVGSKKTTLGKVMDMARQLGASHRILPYIEALS